MSNKLGPSLKMRFINLFAVLMVANAVLAGVDSFEMNSVKNLIGLQNYNSGPNCFNATLVAKGFVKNLVYIDSAEFQFFTESFCEKITQPKAFDILAVVRENTFEHGALYLGGDEIFEKQSATGSLNRFAKPGSSQYKKISRQSSPYFSQYLEGKTFEAYSCLSSQDVLSRINQLCSSEEFYRTVDSLRKKFESISFTNAKYEDSNLLPVEETRRLIQIISMLDGKDDCSVYAFSVAVSTSFNLYYLNNEQQNDEVIVRLKKDLESSLKILKRKIESNNHNVIAAKVLAEAHWVK